MSISDEKILNDAKRIIDEEVSCILDIPKADVPGYIKKQISAFDSI